MSQATPSGWGGRAERKRRLEAAASLERVARRRRHQIRPRTGVQREPAVAECLVTERLDGPAEVATTFGDGDAVDGDVVADRCLVGDGDRPDEKGGAGGAADAVPGAAVALPQGRADVPDATAADVARAELLDDPSGAGFRHDGSRSDDLGQLTRARHGRAKVSRHGECIGAVGSILNRLSGDRAPPLT